jgi:phage tail tape-measure protein
MSGLIMPSCKTIEKGRDGAVLGAAAGGSIGALIGKKAGNPAIGATIGAALGGSTGAFLSKKLYKSSGPGVKPIYVLNGTPYKEKAAQEKLSKVNAESIESVKVLNTDEAIAIYGEKGENGAILINFKSTLLEAGAGDQL